MELFVVLGRRNMGEDRLVYLFGQKSGVQTAIAKYGRKSIKRFLNVLEPSNIIRAHLRVTRFTGKVLVERADIERIWEGIRYDIIKTFSSWFVFEQIAKLRADPSLFAELVEFLGRVEESPSAQVPALAVAFSCLVLAREGFRLELKEDTEVSELYRFFAEGGRFDELSVPRIRDVKREVRKLLSFYAELGIRVVGGELLMSVL